MNKPKKETKKETRGRKPLVTTREMAMVALISQLDYEMDSRIKKLYWYVAILSLTTAFAVLAIVSRIYG